MEKEFHHATLSLMAWWTTSSTTTQLFSHRFRFFYCVPSAAPCSHVPRLFSMERRMERESRTLYRSAVSYPPTYFVSTYSIYGWRPLSPSARPVIRAPSSLLFFTYIYISLSFICTHARTICGFYVTRVTSREQTRLYAVVLNRIGASVCTDPSTFTDHI